MRVSRIHLLASTIIASTLTATAAYAQQTQPNPTPAQEQASDLGEIVVTGTRIRRTDLTGNAPVAVISSETIDNKGFISVANALNELPTSGVPTDASGDQASFGVGRSYVNLFNLGTNRTLVLVNGRRFVSANVSSIFSGSSAGGQVDLSSIPTALIDRVENIQATGGAIYGSDAVAGVINIITKRSFEGLELNGDYGISDRSDANMHRFRATAGKNFFDDRLNLAGSYEYSETDTLGVNDRAHTALQLTRGINPDNTSNTDGIPAELYYLNRRVPELTNGGLAFRTSGIGLDNLITIADPSAPTGRVQAQFGPNGDLIAYNLGQIIQPAVSSGGQGLNLGDLSALQSPVTRHNATIFTTYNFTPRIRLEAEAFYSNTKAIQAYSQPNYNSGLFGGDSGALEISTANIFLTSQARSALLSQPDELPADPDNPGERLFFLQRASTDIVVPRDFSQSETYRLVLNLNGDFEAANRTFYWNIAGNIGRNEGYFTQNGINQKRFLNAINVNAAADGKPQCADANARTAGCKPLNLFGLNAPSAEALAYIKENYRQDYLLEQRSLEANFGGDLFQLPAGPLGFNIGYEYRLEESGFTPNDASRLGLGRAASISGLEGEYNTSEYYAEVSVPVFGGDFSYPLARELTLDGSYRHVKNSTAGEDEAWSGGVRYRPFNDLLLRGSVSRSFRAPAITELFTPESSSFMSATDPCDARNIDSGPNPKARAANCAAAFVALGLPADFELTSNIQAATQRGTTAGNPDLVNEIADQETYGFVYQPNFVQGLTLSFDWVKIKLTNAIANFELGSIMQVCYDVPNPDPAVCGRFQRGRAGTSLGDTDLSGQILGADIAPDGRGPLSGFINAGYLNFSGWSAGAEYTINLEDHRAFAGLGGRLNLNLNYFRTENYETSVTGLGFDETNSANTLGTPETRWKADIGYSKGNFGVIWTTRYTGEVKYSNTATIENYTPLTLSEHYMNDLSLSYNFAPDRWALKDLTARLQIRNVFDTSPPFGTAGIGSYDIIGRYYQIGLTSTF